MTWNPVDSPIDFYTIAGQPSPGVSTLAGAALVFGWEQKKGQGTSGATSKYTGTELASFEAKTQLWLTEHFDAWETFVNPLRQEPGAKALDFWHPLTAALGIGAVVVKEIGQLVEEDDTGLFSVTIKFDQYRAPKPGRSAPKGSAAEGKQDGAEEDPIEKQIAALTEQYKDLQQQ